MRHPLGVRDAQTPHTQTRSHDPCAGATTRPGRRRAAASGLKWAKKRPPQALFQADGHTKEGRTQMKTLPVLAAMTCACSVPAMLLGADSPTLVAIALAIAAVAYTARELILF